MSTVFLDHQLTEGETKARGITLAGAGILHLTELLEDGTSKLLGDSRTVVAYLHPHLILEGKKRDLDRHIFGIVFASICEKDRH